GAVVVGVLAGVAQAVPVGVLLVGIGHGRAVVEAIGDAVAVAVGAGVADVVAVGVELVGVGQGRTVVAQIGDAVAGLVGDGLGGQLEAVDGEAVLGGRLQGGEEADLADGAGEAGHLGDVEGVLVGLAVQDGREADARIHVELAVGGGEVDLGGAG